MKPVYPLFALPYRHPECGALMRERYETCPLCKSPLVWPKRKEATNALEERGAEQGAA